MSSVHQRESLGEENRPQGSSDAVHDLCGSFPRSVSAIITIQYLPGCGVNCLSASVNMSNALTLSLPKDLHFKGTQQNVALTIFFVPYVLFEIPSHFALKRFKPRDWRTSIATSFVDVAFENHPQGLMLHVQCLAAFSRSASSC